MRGSATKRVVISVIATFALLLHSLMTMPASALPFSGSAICMQQSGTAQDDSSGEHEHGHNLCCILACVACGIAYVASVAGLLVFPERLGARVTLARTTPIPASRPLGFYFAARGPPILL